MSEIIQKRQIIVEQGLNRIGHFVIPAIVRCECGTTNIIHEDGTRFGCGRKFDVDGRTCSDENTELPF